MRYMHKIGLINENDLQNFFEDERMIEIYVLNLWSVSVYKGYFVYPSSYILESILDSEEMKLMAKFLDQNQKRKMFYFFLKAQAYSHSKYMQNYPAVDQEKTSGEEIFEMLMKRIFKDDQFIDALEIYHEMGREEKKNLKESKENFPPIAIGQTLKMVDKLFTEIEYNPSLENKEFIQKFLFILKDWVAKEYGRELFEEEKEIGKKAGLKYEIMSYSSMYMEMIDRDSHNFKKPRMSEDQIQENLAEFKAKLKTIAKGSNVDNYFMISDLEEYLHSYNELCPIDPSSYGKKALKYLNIN
ncbi:hypothetical protein PGT21_020622 [Puccinia graminis f. sp. tritici]|uniref:Uncharacterized protein n=1 Tax=Puccinia graminis f. sp. tritici TaxID=56615 RepID=A0A5B0MLV7_PUCGR|nr:hypothetical protein PGT21_020622 [Puccinia graminis f. sp. tritici]KAA1126985.1 hypothetical protein PGTUg99_034945 [Puccinia graminis f. sp. tritici]